MPGCWGKGRKRERGCVDGMEEINVGGSEGESGGVYELTGRREGRKREGLGDKMEEGKVDGREERCNREGYKGRGEGEGRNGEKE